MQGAPNAGSPAQYMLAFSCVVLSYWGLGMGRGGGEGNAPVSGRGRHAAAALHIAKAGIVWTDVLIYGCVPSVPFRVLIARPV